LINTTDNIIILSNDEELLRLKSKEAWSNACVSYSKNFKLPKKSVGVAASLVDRVKILDIKIFGKNFIQAMADIRYVDKEYALPNNAERRNERRNEYMDDKKLLLAKAFGEESEVLGKQVTSESIGDILNVSRLFLIQLRKERLITLPMSSVYLFPKQRSNTDYLSDIPHGLKTFLTVLGDDSVIYLPSSGLDGHKPSVDAQTSIPRIFTCCLLDNAEDVTPELIQELMDVGFTRLTLKVALTLISDNIETVWEKELFWRTIIPIPGLVVMDDEYGKFRQALKLRKKRSAKLPTHTSLSSITSDGFIEFITQAIEECTVNNGVFDFDRYAEKLVYISRINLNPRDFIKASPFPDDFDFDWQGNSAHWVESQNRYLDMKQYESDKPTIQALQPLNVYLFLFLPVWFHFNQSSKIAFPKRVDDFNGSYFVSRPHGVNLDSELPLTLVIFISGFKVKVSKRTTYNVLRVAKDFFTTVASRYSIYGVGKDFSCPILPHDLPKTTRMVTSNKARMPGEIYWLSLLYCIKIHEITSVINTLILDGKITNSQMNGLKNKTVDEFKFLLNTNSLFQTLGITKIDSTITFRGKTVEVEHVPLMLLSVSPYPIIGRDKPVRLINPSVIIQIIVSLETGLRHQSIQWLSTDFDKLVTEGNIVDENIYRLLISVDKIKKEEWAAAVSGRVITILRSLKSFRDMVDDPELQIPQPYERREASKWKNNYWLMGASGAHTGFPHSDSTYSKRFKQLLVGLQGVVSSFGIEYPLYNKIKGPAQIQSDITPHSTRVTVISELISFLTPEYIGAEITGQTAATVAYYAKLDNRQINDLESAQKNYNSQLTNIHNEGLVKVAEVRSIDTTSPTANIVRSFRNNPKNALADHSAICTSFDNKMKTGVDAVLDSDVELDVDNFSFEKGHVCPYNNTCPEYILRLKLEHRCDIAPCAIRSVDHLPYISARRRTMIEQLTETAMHVNENKASYTDQELRDVDESQRILAENITGLVYAEKVLNDRLKSLNKGEGGKFISFTPDAVNLNLTASSFPSKDRGDEYLIARIGELKSYPSLQAPEMKAAYENLRIRLLTNTGNIRELLSGGTSNPVDSIYGIIKSLMDTKGLTVKELTDLASIDVDSAYTRDPELSEIEGETLRLLGGES
jgi:hypothetical protein